MPDNISSTNYSLGHAVLQHWLLQQGKIPFEYQQQVWDRILHLQSGLVNSPTGTGKTFSVFLGALIQFINQYPTQYKQKKNNGLQLLWVTPLRALSKDIARSMEEVIQALEIPWQVGIRNGDTSAAERQKQFKRMPEILVTTPESFHLIIAQKSKSEVVKTLRMIAVDEWHELQGSKRGVMMELAISHLVFLNKKNSQFPLQVWGLSATIGNLHEAMQVLLYPIILRDTYNETHLIQSHLNKQIQVQAIYPDEIETYPWAGHLGLKLAHKLIPIIEESNSTLLFINTRGMSESWYQAILEQAPHLAGCLAIHHGSIEQEIRLWVEEALHQRKLKCVVCTASLDLGVDFRPVDTVIQVGSPKGVSRFLQRAGRSGHQPNATSKIYFLPTNSLELIEVAALKKAISQQIIESKEPLLLCFDVLIQYLSTLAVGEGFFPEDVYEQVKHTFCFQEIIDNEWFSILQQITTGGKALQHYADFKKIEIDEHSHLWHIKSRKLAMRHRLGIGAIVSDAMLKVKLQGSGYIGVIEEWFISRLNIGDSFILAGKNVELMGIKDMTVMVKKSKSTKTIIPSWMGGRMPLSSNLGSLLRTTLQQVSESLLDESIQLEEELHVLKPLFNLQHQFSSVPKSEEFLVEYFEEKKSYHLYMYPFEGRLIHEAMAAIVAYRISKEMPISFSMAMNDYGFELMSDSPIPVTEQSIKRWLTEDNLLLDIQSSVNHIEMARRKFRDIAVISGLIINGIPGQPKKARHLQSSASLLFNVFSEYEPDNLLIKQAYYEVFSQQMEEARLRKTLKRIATSQIILHQPSKLTPFCFPIKVDGLNRENLTSEKLEDRIRKMQKANAK